MTITIKAKQVFAYGSLLLLGFFVAMYVYWSAQSNKVLQINNDPVPVNVTEVQAGSRIYLTVDFCKSRRVTGVSTVYLVGETKGSKPEIVWPLDTSGKQCVIIEVPVSIPDSVQSDTYHVVFETTYRVNPLKKQVVVFRSRSFKVVNQALDRE